MKRKLLICLGLISLILCSSSNSLPPSVETLNNLVDIGKYKFGFRSIFQDDNKNLIVYFTQYDSTMLMNVYRFQINNAGELFENPHIILPLTGMYDDFKVIGDRHGRSHLIAGFFMSNSCDWDAAYEIDPPGNSVIKVVSRPPGDLSCCNIISDSVFVAARIGDEEGCWNEMDYNSGDLYFQIIRSFPSDTIATLTNLPLLNPGFYPTAIEEIQENILLAIAEDVQRSRYFYYGEEQIEAENYVSYILDIENHNIVAVDSGNIFERAGYIIPNFARSIAIYGPSSIWVGNKLLYYFRLFPFEYYEGNVNDSLCVLIFDKNGKKAEMAEVEGPKFLYKEINVFDSTERLIPILTKTAERNWKYKFGLVSFRDFPQIYIDLGEEQ